MSLELQQNIQSFLEDIIYINSSQTRKSSKNRQRIFGDDHNRDRGEQSPQKSIRKGKIGKIVNQKKWNKSERISDFQEWKKMEKSLQKLKATNSPLNRDPDRNRNPTNTNTNTTNSINPNNASPYNYTNSINSTNNPTNSNLNSKIQNRKMVRNRY